MDEKLREYASLLVRVGLNVQKGQRLVISSPVECAYFARMCAQEAYDVGCKEVVMNWHDDAMARMKYLQADDAIFDEVALWRRHFFNDYALEGAAYLAISASDPENFKGEVNSSSVGMLAIYSWPDRVTSLPASQMWPSGSSTVRAVPRELV